MTNPWVSSPSPSLEAADSDLSSSSALSVGLHVALALPRQLWDTYVAHLWSYHPDSFVGRVASSFRILAIVLVLPVVLLTLLDVTSYVIARTLGVDDVVKVPTSDPCAVAADERRIEVVSDGPACGSKGRAGEGPIEGPAGGGGSQGGSEDGDGGGDGRVTSVSVSVQGEDDRAGVAKSETLEAPREACYFGGEEALLLAGEGVFSPAGSGPPSPHTPHMPSFALDESDGRGSGQASEEEGIVLRRRVPGSGEDELAHI